MRPDGESSHIETQLRICQVAIGEFCRRWGVSELALFGSSRPIDLRSESEVPVIITLDDAFRHTLFDMHQMEQDLGHVLGQDIHLVSRRGIEMSRNQRRRRAILGSVRVIYRS